MSTERTCTASYFPLGHAPLIDAPVYAGLVLGQPGMVLVTRCLHPHRTPDEATQCARDLAHVATLPGELQDEWLDRTNRPRRLPNVADDAQRADMERRAREGAATRRAAALQCLDDVHAYLAG